MAKSDAFNSFTIDFKLGVKSLIEFSEPVIVEKAGMNLIHAAAIKAIKAIKFSLVSKKITKKEKAETINIAKISKNNLGNLETKVVKNCNFSISSIFLKKICEKKFSFWYIFTSLIDEKVWWTSLKFSLCAFCKIFPLLTKTDL